MKKFKRIATFVLSMVMLFSFVTTTVFADGFVRSYSRYRESDDMMIMYFHVDGDGEQMESYARVSGDTWTAQDCNINCRTYVTNDYKGTEWETVYTTVAVVSVYSEYDNGMSGTEIDYAQCTVSDDILHARVDVGSSIDYEPEDEYIENFESRHWLLAGITWQNAAEDEFGDWFYRYQDSETIIIYTDEESLIN